MLLPPIQVSKIIKVIIGYTEERERSREREREGGRDGWSIPVDAKLGSRNVGNGGATASGNESVLALNDLIADLDLVGSHIGGLALEEGDVRLSEVPLVDAVQPLYVGISLLLDGSPVERHVTDGEAVVRCVMQTLT